MPKMSYALTTSVLPEKTITIAKKTTVPLKKDKDKYRERLQALHELRSIILFTGEENNSYDHNGACLSKWHSLLENGKESIVPLSTVESFPFDEESYSDCNIHVYNDDNNNNCHASSSHSFSNGMLEHDKVQSTLANAESKQYLCNVSLNNMRTTISPLTNHINTTTNIKQRVNRRKIAKNNNHNNVLVEVAKKEQESLEKAEQGKCKQEEQQDKHNDDNERQRRFSESKANNKSTMFTNNSKSNRNNVNGNNNTTTINITKIELPVLPALHRKTKTITVTQYYHNNNNDTHQNIGNVDNVITINSTKINKKFCLKGKLKEVTQLQEPLLNQSSSLQETRNSSKHKSEMQEHEQTYKRYQQLTHLYVNHVNNATTSNTTLNRKNIISSNNNNNNKNIDKNKYNIDITNTNTRDNNDDNDEHEHVAVMSSEAYSNKSNLGIPTVYVPSANNSNNKSTMKKSSSCISKDALSGKHNYNHNQQNRKRQSEHTNTVSLPTLQNCKRHNVLSLVYPDSNSFNSNVVATFANASGFNSHHVEEEEEEEDDDISSRSNNNMSDITSNTIVYLNTSCANATSLSENDTHKKETATCNSHYTEMLQETNETNKTDESSNVTSTTLSTRQTNKEKEVIDKYAPIVNVYDRRHSRQARRRSSLRKTSVSFVQVPPSTTAAPSSLVYLQHELEEKEEEEKSIRVNGVEAAATSTGIEINNGIWKEEEPHHQTIMWPERLVNTHNTDVIPLDLTDKEHITQMQQHKENTSTSMEQLHKTHESPENHLTTTESESFTNNNNNNDSSSSSNPHKDKDTTLLSKHIQEKCVSLNKESKTEYNNNNMMESNNNNSNSCCSANTCNMTLPTFTTNHSSWRNNATKMETNKRLSELVQKEIVKFTPLSLSSFRTIANKVKELKSNDNTSNNGNSVTIFNKIRPRKQSVSFTSFDAASGADETANSYDNRKITDNVLETKATDNINSNNNNNTNSNHEEESDKRKEETCKEHNYKKYNEWERNSSGSNNGNVVQNTNSMNSIVEFVVPIERTSTAIPSEFNKPDDEAKSDIDDYNVYNDEGACNSFNNNDKHTRDVQEILINFVKEVGEVEVLYVIHDYILENNNKIVEETCNNEESSKHNIGKTKRREDMNATMANVCKMLLTRAKEVLPLECSSSSSNNSGNKYNTVQTNTKEHSNNINVNCIKTDAHCAKQNEQITFAKEHTRIREGKECNTPSDILVMSKLVITNNNNKECVSHHHHDNLTCNEKEHYYCCHEQEDENREKEEEENDCSNTDSFIDEEDEFEEKTICDIAYPVYSTKFNVARPSVHGRVTRVFEEGMLYRIKDSVTGKYFFYNDTQEYMMFVRVECTLNGDEEINPNAKVVELQVEEHCHSIKNTFTSSAITTTTANIIQTSTTSPQNYNNNSNSNNSNHNNKIGNTDVVSSKEVNESKLVQITIAVMPEETVFVISGISSLPSVYAKTFPLPLHYKSPSFVACMSNIASQMTTLRNALST